jgi:hypothetical protein
MEIFSLNTFSNLKILYTYYSRYADDIFIIYDSTITDPDSLTNSMHNIHTDIIFKATPETKNQINFLDLLIVRNETSIEIDIIEIPPPQTKPLTSFQTTL